MLFRAVRDIAAGEELTWRYHASQQGRGGADGGAAVGASRSKSDLFGEAPRCFCGSRKCCGSL